MAILDVRCFNCGSALPAIIGGNGDTSVIIRVKECEACIAARQGKWSAEQTDVQHLKAEIAALADNLDLAKSYGCKDVSLSIITHRLRQLSAV